MISQKMDHSIQTESVSLEVAPHWPQAVRDRIASLSNDDTVINARVEAINQALSGDVRVRILRQAMAAPTAVQKIQWLRREADLLVKAAAPVSACRKGCSHCCNIGVMVYEQEAQIIGRAIGVKPKTPHPDVVFDVSYASNEADTHSKIDILTNEFLGTPCTFLKEGSCSIYADRPMNCRLQINIDVDETLCELVPGGSIPVPYLNVENSRSVYAMAMARKSDGGSRMSDLRHFFPKGLS